MIISTHSHCDAPCSHSPPPMQTPPRARPKTRGRYMRRAKRRPSSTPCSIPAAASAVLSEAILRAFYAPQDERISRILSELVELDAGGLEHLVPALDLAPDVRVELGRAGADRQRAAGGEALDHFLV